MKKVIMENETVTVQEVSLDKFYGYSNGSGSKGFCLRSGYDKGAFRFVSLESFTRGNGYTEIEGQTLSQTIESLIKSNNLDFFEFNTAKELFSWLAED
jgi:hypothetical protein